MSQSTPIRLGLFELHGRFAEGGMAEVWRGVHVAQQVPIAVKVIHAEEARNPRYFDLFRREVQAVARLRHAGIVLVFDYGTLPPEAEVASGGRLVAGSPYLVMEFASGGALDGVIIQSWAQAREVLLALLDALAHAHARGVIHRDLKPSNVLLSGPGDLRPGVKLTDFGIAHHANPSATTANTYDARASRGRGVEGTVTYMPPEQLKGAWRDFGPATDLYALGVMAYELITGSVPFDGPVHEVLYAHLHRPLPRLRPRFAVPEGLETWLHHMTAKDPSWRFARACDAAWHLANLGGGMVAPLPPPGPPSRPIPALARRTMIEAEPAPAPANRTVLEGVGVPASAQATMLEGGQASQAAQRAPAPVVKAPSEPLPERAPLPEDWRESGEQTTSMRLVGAGLGLYGLREIPMVDRDGPRARLWGGLRGVDGGAGPQAIVLSGEPGVGKSRLAQWLSELAHEVGLEVLKAPHEPVRGRGGGLVHMMSDLFLCAGLEGTRLVDHLGQHLGALGLHDPYDWRQLADMLSTSTSGLTTSDHHMVVSPTERYALFERVLGALSTRRPVVVWLDDIQWGFDSLAFVEHVLGQFRREPFAVFFLLTVRTDLLDEDPLLGELLGRLQSTGAVAVCPVEPLEPEDNAALVEQLLGLSGDLARQVAERTAGHPLFAVQLVGDWVQRGVLEVGDKGFVLKSGERAPLPDDLHDLWNERIERALVGSPRQARILLEAAALLGRQVDEHELQGLMSALGTTFPRELLEVLLERQLATLEASGWSFAHGMLRESLLRSARDAGRQEALNLVCARVLQRLYPGGALGVSERLARHLIDGGATAEALEPLLKAAQERNLLSEYKQALALLEERAELMARAGVPEDDPRWGEAQVLRATILRLHWQFKEAEVEAGRALEGARRHGWASLLPSALSQMAHLARQRGDLKQAIAFNQEALEHFRGLGDQHGVAQITLAMAIITRQQGELTESAGLYADAWKMFRGLGDTDNAAKCRAGLGNVCRQRRDFDGATFFYGDARQSFEETGNRHELANVINNLAEIARYQGDLAAAAEGYQRAIELHQRIGSNADLVPRLNLSLVLRQQGRYEGARVLLDEGLDQLTRQNRRPLMAWVMINLLPCVAHAGDFDAFDDHLQQGRALLEETSMVDNDIAEAAQLAAELLLAMGEGARARAADEVALAQWEAVGDAAASEAARVRLRGYPAG